MTITPGEGAIIAADAADKNGDIKLEFVDRFTGCLVFTGDVASVESALAAAVRALKEVLGFTPAPITRT
jgi:ethanolamine utilization protein EutS